MDLVQPLLLPLEAPARWFGPSSTSPTCRSTCPLVSTQFNLSYCRSTCPLVWTPFHLSYLQIRPPAGLDLIPPPLLSPEAPARWSGPSSTSPTCRSACPLVCTQFNLSYLQKRLPAGLDLVQPLLVALDLGLEGLVPRPLRVDGSRRSKEINQQIKKLGSQKLLKTTYY